MPDTPSSPRQRITPPAVLTIQLRPSLHPPKIVDAPITFGPLFFSVEEAAAWAETASQRILASRTTRPATRRTWHRTKRRIAPSEPIAVLDLPKPEADAARTHLRRRTLRAAIANVVPKSTPAAVYEILDTVAGETVRTLAECADQSTPDARRAALESAAATLLGCGRRMRNVLGAKSWPRLWTPRTYSGEHSEAAAVLYWREKKGQWPMGDDPVWAYYRDTSRRPRLHA